MNRRSCKPRALQDWRTRRHLLRLRTEERRDVLAFLARKRANALTIAARSPDFADEARWIVRQIEILSDDIRAGLHLGEALLEAERRANEEL